VQLFEQGAIQLDFCPRALISADSTQLWREPHDDGFDSGRPDDITSMASEPAGRGQCGERSRAGAALVEQLAREASENKDKLLRALAEMENMRRRTDRQVADAREYGITAFARDVLAVARQHERALSAIDPQLRETADAASSLCSRALS